MRQPAAYPGGDAVGAHRLQPGEEQTTVEQWVVGCVDDLPCGDRSAARSHAARRAGLDAEHPHVLQHDGAIPVDRLREPLDVSDRV